MTITQMDLLKEIKASVEDELSRWERYYLGSVRFDDIPEKEFLYKLTDFIIFRKF